MLSYPLNNQEKGAIENARFAELNVRRLKGGLPVFTAAPTYTGIEGEIIWVNDSGIYSLYAYINAGWRQLATTAATKLTYTEIEPPNWAANANGNNAWANWDLSSYVPAGTTEVLVLIKMDFLFSGAAWLYLGIRANGSSVDTTLPTSLMTMENHAPGFMTLISKVDGDRIVERKTYASGSALWQGTYFTITGYWK